MYSTFKLMKPLEERRSTVLGKHLVDFILHPVAETVDGNEIRFLISGQPDIMDVTVKELFNFPAGVDVVHIGIQNDLEHPRVVRATPAFLIQIF